MTCPSSLARSFSRFSTVWSHISPKTVFCFCSTKEGLPQLILENLFEITPFCYYAFSLSHSTAQCAMHAAPMGRTPSLKMTFGLCAVYCPRSSM